VDFVTAFAAVGAAGLIWRVRGPLDLGWGVALLAAFGLALAFSLVNHMMGVQRIAWRYASAGEVLEVGMSAGAATGLLMLGNALLPGRSVFPPAMLILAGFFALAGFAATRYRRRLLAALQERWLRLTATVRGGREKVVVVGAGEAGQLMVWLMKYGPRGQAFHVIGIVDDDLRKHGERIHGVRVLGPCHHIPRLVGLHGVSQIVFAIHNIQAAAREPLLELCRSTGARVVVMPDIMSVIWRLASAGKVEDGRPANNGGPNPAPGSRIPVMPPVRIGDATGFYVETELVAAWLRDLARLTAEGRTATVEQRIQEIQRNLGLTPMPKVGGMPPAPSKAKPTASAIL